MVDGWRVVAHKREFASGLMGGADVFCNGPHTPFNKVEHLHGEGAHRALQLAAVGHHIGRVTRVDHGDRNDACIDGLQVARHNGLKSLHHLAGDGHRVYAVVRQSGVTAFATDGDFELVARRHHWPCADRQGAYRHARPVVQTEHRIHRKLLEQPVFDHLASAAATFFGGLKNQHHGAIKVFVLGQMLRCCQQHGGVTIVAAGVHLAGVFAGVSEGVGLVHRQSIHIGT